MLKNIKDLTLEELTSYFKEKNLPAFRAKQCFKWLSMGVCDFDEMTDLKKEHEIKSLNKEMLDLYKTYLD